jgi:hypothetical protein
MRGIISVNDFIENGKGLFDCETAALVGPVRLLEDQNTLTNGELTITGNEYSNFVEELGIPAKYAEKVPKDLMVDHINFLLNAKRDLRIRVDDSGIIRSFHPSYLPFTLEELVTNVTKITGSELLDQYSMVDESGAVVYSVAENFVSEPKPGDFVNGGLAVNVNIDGFIEAFPYTFQLVCANGAIHTVKYGSWAKGRDEAFPAWFEKVGQLYSEGARETLDFVTALTHKRVDPSMNIDRLIDIVSTYVKVSQKVKKSLIEFVSKSQSNDMFDVWSTITRFLTHEFDAASTTKRFHVLKYGGAVCDASAGNGISFCTTCGRPVLMSV